MFGNVHVLEKGDVVRFTCSPQTAGILIGHGWRYRKVDELERYLWRLWLKAKHGNIGRQSIEVARLSKESEGK